MKELKSRLSPPLRIKELLAKHVGGHEDARSVEELHASELTKQDVPFCPREVVLMRLLGVSRQPQYVPHALRATFDAGRDQQARLNNRYLRDYMVGGWRCIKCDETHAWSRYPDEGDTPCVRGPHLWEYVEPVFHHPSGFTGSIDGVVQFSPAKLRMVEFKIVKGEPSAGSSAPNFKEIIAPLAEHRLRTILYLRLIAESPDARTSQIDVSVAHVLYISRGHGAKDESGRISPFKEFLVHRNDEYVSHYVRMANAVKEGMPEGICASALCARATKCAVVKQCFSGKYPPTVFWDKAP